MRDINALNVFVAVAQILNFRQAAERLGVTPSAVSQTISRLEGSLGVVLLQRTTRSTRLTEAGERLYRQILPAVSSIDRVLSDFIDIDQQPGGTLRLAVSSIAERFISGDMLAGFIRKYPEVELDITITDLEFDIVAGHYDAGVRLGEIIELDMVAIPVSGKQRQLAVASPDYLRKNSAPRHPSELLNHVCIGWRMTPDIAPYRWDFEKDGNALDVAVEPQLTTNDMGVMIRTACAGGGITFGLEETFRPYIEKGLLVPLLEPWLPVFEGFYLYFPKNGNILPRMRALIDHMRY